MPVQLKDARITVVLDMAETGAKVESLEKRTVEHRRKVERDERRQRDRERDSERRQRSVRGAAAAGVVGAARGAAGRVASAAGTVIAIGVIVEQLMPAVIAFLTEQLPEAMKAAGVDDWIRERANDVVETLVSDRLSDISAGFGAFGATKDIARAQAVLGQPVTAQDLLDVAQEEFRVRKALDQGSRAQDRLTRGLVGEMVGKAVSGWWR